MEFLIYQTVFSDFRSVFILMLLIAFVSLIFSVIPRGRNSNINFLTILTISIINILVSGMLLYTENSLIKSLNMEADKLTFYFFIAVLILSIVNPIIFNNRNKKSQRYRYRG